MKHKRVIERLSKQIINKIGIQRQNLVFASVCSDTQIKAILKDYWRVINHKDVTPLIKERTENKLKSLKMGLQKMRRWNLLKYTENPLAIADSPDKERNGNKDSRKPYNKRNL